MFNSASELQLRLEDHFADLSTRAKKNERLIFAIEHGLELAEIEELKNLVRKSLKTEGLNSKFWLLWVIYAAEHGYTFDGVQFWDNFSEQTSGWQSAGDRKKIRTWFQRFKIEYCGVAPSGAWAKHFSIISWPIAHAILPKDLQRRLAKAMYEAQYELRRVSNQSAIEIGRTLSRATQQSSQRFRLFLDQEEMLGQIVISLLGTPEQVSGGIDPRALKRITHDLNDMRDAKDWIRQAQKTWQSAKPQFKINGPIDLELRSDDKVIASDKTLPQKLINLKPAIEAQKISGGYWQFELTVPSFQDVAALDETFSTFLCSNRVSIPLAETRMLPGEWLLTGMRKRILKKWPAKGEGFIIFEDAPPFDKIVDWNLALAEKSIWAFKFQNDGTARLLTGDHLRAKNSYLLITPKDVDLQTVARSCLTNCLDINLWRIDLPAIISSELQDALTLLGFQCKKILTLSAAGIPPVDWVPDVGGTWLSSGRPLLSIDRDHEFDGYQLCINESERIDVRTSYEKKILIELPQLTTGQHFLRIHSYKLIEGNKNFQKIQATQDLQITIKDPKPWTSGATNNAAIFVNALPLMPSVEDFLAAGLELEVLGDNSLTCKIEIVLKRHDGIQLFRASILDHALPISNAMWSQHYQNFLRTNSSNQKFYECSSALLEISSAEFGKYCINLDQQFAALRWIPLHKNGVQYLRLIEHDSGEDIAASFSDFKTALQDVVLESPREQGSLTVPANSGLYRAKCGELSQNIIFAPTDIHSSLTNLKMPFSPEALSVAEDYAFILQRATIWYNATATTYLAKHWKKKLVEMLYQKVLLRFCGKKWAVAENKLADDSTEDSQWENLESLVTLPPPNFGIAVGKIFMTEETSISDLQLGLEILVKKYKLDSVNDEALKAAWKIAWFDHFFAPLTEEECDVALHFGTIIRAARLLRLRFHYKKFMLKPEGHL